MENRQREGTPGRPQSYNDEVLVEIPHAGERELDEAHAGAVKAQKAWAAMLPADRSAVMRKAAEVMERRHDEIVGWLIAESGSTRIKAELEWAAVRAVMLEASFAPYRVEGRILPGDVPGIGRFGGDWAVDAFTTDKWVTVQHVPRAYPHSADVLKGPWAGG